MAKQLSEILSVEPDLRKASESILAETGEVFTKKHHHFLGMLKMFESNNEKDLPKPPESNQQIVTTVRDKLDWTFENLIKSWDGSFQIATANQEAKGDIIVGEKVLAKDVPATFLLEMERNILPKLRSVLLNIPTHDPSRIWNPDPAKGKNIFQADDKVTFRTQKVRKHVVVVPPTEKHPAQIDVQDVDVEVGRMVTKEWSGMYTPAAKAELLTRFDDLHRAIKMARQRANKVEVKKGNIAKTLTDFILG